MEVETDVDRPEIKDEEKNGEEKNGEEKNGEEKNEEEKYGEEKNGEEKNGVEKKGEGDTEDRMDTEATNPDASGRDFSSENYKIELQNLPKYFGMGQMKKLVNNKLKLNAHKLKPCGSSYMFVCFRNEEDKEKALLVLDGFTFKGNKLKAVSAKAAADPYKQKTQQPREMADDRPLEERIQEALCPLAKLSYDAQLAKKLEEVVTVVKRLGAEISKCNPGLTEFVRTSTTKHGVVAPIQEFLRSPVTQGYRNKCEFSIGYMNTEHKSNVTDTEEKEKLDIPETKPTISVGFRLASYKQGSVEVVSLASLPSAEQTLPHISPQMIKIGILVEQFVQVSGILPYNSLTNKGNWRHVMIRCTGIEQEQIMVVLILDSMGLSKLQLDQVRSDLKLFFTEGAGKPCKVTNLFLHLAPAKKVQGSSDPVPELLFGDPVITETLFYLSFSISPQAFFQVNSKAAEVLYACVGDLAELQDKGTLVDVCCGTGTIGLCLASRVKQVIGVELVPEAVRDARKNAERNGIKNCSFFAGRAENILGEILRDIDSSDVVAVVDPPRAGLHHKALSAIRNNLAIKRLVYVSCDAKAAMKNFVDLSRPASKTAKGDPFVPVQIVPVDLFPHTRGFELVLLFQRISEEEQKRGELDEKKVEEINPDESLDLQAETSKEVTT